MTKFNDLAQFIGGETAFECRDCGAIVTDFILHREWHRKLNELIKENHDQ